LHEHGKLGKTEFWYVLDVTPGASIIHGFKATTSRGEVQQAIKDVNLELLLNEVCVSRGDIIFVPAGTVHGIGGGVLLYELQEYSDVTYRLYDYGRLTSSGTHRELHIERSLDVTHYDRSSHIKMLPLVLRSERGLQDRCLAACQYFVTRELTFEQSGISHDYMNGVTAGSCRILSSLGAEITVRYGEVVEHEVKLVKGQTMVLPAALDNYSIEGTGIVLFSYVPAPDDEIRRSWEMKNGL
jgi:mannose-6-phosphate isomerase